MNRASASCGKISHGSKYVCLEMSKMKWERTEEVFEEKNLSRFDLKL